MRVLVRRAVAFLVMAALLVGQTAHAEIRTENVIKVERYPNGEIKMVVWKEAGGGQVVGQFFVLPPGRFVPYQEFKRANSFLYQKRSEVIMDSRTRYTVPKLNGSLLSMVATTFHNFPLAWQAMKDIQQAMGGHFNPEAMENLRDPAKRYEFWKQAGIYEKYTAREIAFINSVVFPLLAVQGVAEMLLATAVAGSGAATRLGPYGGLFVSALVLGYAGGELIGMISDVLNGRPVAPSNFTKAILNGWGFLAGLAGVGAGFGTGWLTLAVRKFADLVWPVAKGAGVTLPEAMAMGKLMAGIPAVLAGTEAALDASVFIGKLLNVWGIPVPEGQPFTACVEGCEPPGQIPTKLPDKALPGEVWVIGRPRLEN